MKRILKACCLTLLIMVVFQQANAQSLCDRVSEIRMLPFKGATWSTTGSSETGGGAWLEKGFALISAVTSWLEPCKTPKTTELFVNSSSDHSSS